MFIENKLLKKLLEFQQTDLMLPKSQIMVTYWFGGTSAHKSLADSIAQVVIINTGLYIS